MAVVVGGTTVTGTQTLLASVLTGTASAINGSAITNIAGGKITPSAATSSLFVIASSPQIYNNGVEAVNAWIYQGTGGEGSGSAVQGCVSDGGGYSGNTDSPATMTVHIPASGVTTADHTFTVMHANDNNSTLVGWYQGASGHDSEITVMEILA